MSKLSFRARALDASKQMPIFMAEELPDLPEYSAINRAVPQMPSGMEKEEECEHHLQRAICAGLIIPTPEVSAADPEAYNRLYPADYKQPRQLIHMQPFAMEQDIPDYDMDSEDERWLVSQAKKLDLTTLKFEEMMDRLEKSSGQTVVTLNEAKALLKEDDDLIIAVFDYWLNKRLKMQHPLILSVKTEHRVGSAANNPYLAFRRRTEKMQTRKNRKNDETSYEKMLKLRRDLSRAVTLLELVKRREKTKREYLHLTIEVFEKRYQAQDFNGTILAELSTLKASRPAFTQIFPNHYSNQSWANKAIIKDEIIPRKEKRQYKKRKHKNSSHGRIAVIPGSGMDGLASSDEEEIAPQHSPEPEDNEEEGQFTFRRNKHCTYHMPLTTMGNWPWCPPDENGLADRKFRFTLTSLAHPKKCIGFARRRLGRGGRVVLDRASTNLDDFWRQLDFTVFDSVKQKSTEKQSGSETWTNDGMIVDSISETNIYNSNSRNSTQSSGVSVLNNIHSSQATVPSNPVSEVLSDIKCEIKSEMPNRTDVCESIDNCDQDELLEVFREIQKDWLHFRPKTPPPSYEEASGNLTPEIDAFPLTNTVPITVELQNLTSDSQSTLLDDSMFTTTPFTLQELFSDAVSELPVLYDDTRQDDTDTDRTFGCSRFRVVNANSSDVSINNSAVDECVTPKKKSILSSTLTSPKYNSVNVSPDNLPKQNVMNHISNGPLSHSELATSNRKGNKMHHNAYTSGTWNARGSYITATSTLNSDRNLRYATHTTVTTHTLNSHSANILDITSLSNETSDSTKMNSQCVDNNVTANNKQNKQAIVRKNNSLVMEVT